MKQIPKIISDSVKFEKCISESEELEVIQLFQDKLLEVVKQLLYPVFFKTIVYFYSPAID